MNKVTAVAAGLVFASAAALGLINKWEFGRKASVYRVYADKLANGLPTSECNGITRYVTTTPLRVGDVWTQAQCDAETKVALDKVQTALIQCFARVPPQSVFDAATSHAWNFGVGRTCGSSSMRAWNAGGWDEGCRRLLFSSDGRLTWVYSGGKFVRGLANRRSDELILCITGKVP